MVDLADVDCQVTLQLRRVLATRSRAAAVDFAIKHLVSGYSSRSFLREVAVLLRPLPPNRRGNKPFLDAETEFQMMAAYRQAVDWGATPVAARKEILARFKPGIGDRQLRRKVAAWEEAGVWT